MDVIITEWGLQSYLNLKSKRVFSDQEYWSTIRPDVERLKGGLPSADPKFQLSSFWGPATWAGKPIQHGFKMKWDSVGSGSVELRLLVVHWANAAYLCDAYVKSSPSIDRRMMAKLKDRINMIAIGSHQERGKL